MAKAKRPEARTKRVEPMDRIANLLALLLVKDAKPGEAIMTLSRVGFGDEEISTLLNKTVGTIRQTRYVTTKN